MKHDPLRELEMLTVAMIESFAFNAFMKHSAIQHTVRQIAKERGGELGQRVIRMEAEELADQESPSHR